MRVRAFAASVLPALKKKKKIQVFLLNASVRGLPSRRVRQCLGTFSCREADAVLPVLPGVFTSALPTQPRCRWASGRLWSVPAWSEGDIGPKRQLMR